MDIEAQDFKQHLKDLFPNLDITKLQKTHTQKVEEYISWKIKHCIEIRYLFMIRKCDNLECCPPRRLAQEHLRWLPSPLIDDDGVHHKKYEDLSHLDESDEKDRPSLKVIPTKSRSTSAPAVDVETAVSTPSPSTAKDSESAKSEVAMSAQNGRARVICAECTKPRVVYCNKKLDIRHKMMSSFDYTCGSHLFSPNDKRKLALSMVLRPNLQCAMQVEVSYYGSDVGRRDICSHCGIEGAIVDAELKKCFKTVLPMCDHCKEIGEKTFTQRPFGKTKNQKK